LIIYENHFGDNHLESASILARLGLFYSNNGERSKGKELLSKALRVQENHLGEDHPICEGTRQALLNLNGPHDPPKSQYTPLKVILKVVCVSEAIL
jgi:hypothetical protein